MAIKKRKITRKNSSNSKKSSAPKNKIKLVWRNFTFFLVIFLISVILYSLSINELLKNFFGIVSIIFGGLTFALLILSLVLLILKTGRRK